MQKANEKSNYQKIHQRLQDCKLKTDNSHGLAVGKNSTYQDNSGGSIQRHVTFQSTYFKRIRGVTRAKKVGSINEKFLATPSNSLKICCYPFPTPIFSSIYGNLKYHLCNSGGGEGQVPLYLHGHATEQDRIKGSLKTKSKFQFILQHHIWHH